PFEQTAAEDGDHAAYIARFLPRAVDVKISKDRGVEAMQVRERSDIAFARKLADPVVRRGRDRVLFVGRLVDGLAVHGPGRCVDELSNTPSYGDVEKVERP